ncbi:hypothetical protein OJJOAM_003647 [Cupriavidus sp. H18C1]
MPSPGTGPTVVWRRTGYRRPRRCWVPLMLPPTARGQAKRASLPLAGYSPSGLDRLLRAAWRDFVALPEHADHRSVRFTPRMLVRREAGEP